MNLNQPPNIKLIKHTFQQAETYNSQHSNYTITIHKVKTPLSP